MYAAFVMMSWVCKKNVELFLSNISLTYKSVATYAPSVKSNALSKSNRKVRIRLSFKQTEMGSDKSAKPFRFSTNGKKQAGPFQILPES
jgi:hypothetical protein